MHHEADSPYRNTSPKVPKDQQPIPVFIINNTIENNHDFAINAQHFREINTIPNSINSITLETQRPKKENMEIRKKQLGANQ
ncbi:hypothetical protein [uncultured Thiothrix sp.]|uniref:hypothetical protein n=1 Tax=uncultured Thiothrix sp. TaxID=223185 RepID=UPI002624E7EC|nr:hypothetical protein [uncultured Thiothrix sp.]